MIIVGDDRVTSVNIGRDGVRYIAGVSQKSKPAGMAHPFDTRHEWKYLER